MNSPKVILASQSPRRRQIFHALDIPFLAESADVDETPVPNESPSEMVERLAIAKALAVGRRLNSHTNETESRSPDEYLVIGADTVVAVNDVIFGKPADAGEARAMLTRLRARPHQVHSAVAVALFANGKLMRRRSRINTTTVKMRPYNNEDIAAYVATGDPLDKAGAYAIQHQQFRPVESLSGCPAGVMGLPVADLLHLLSEFNVYVEPTPFQICDALTGFPCCQQQSTLP